MELLRRTRNHLLFFVAGFIAAHLLCRDVLAHRFTLLWEQRRPPAENREATPLNGDGEGAPSRAVPARRTAT